MKKISLGEHGEFEKNAGEQYDLGLKKIGLGEYSGVRDGTDMYAAVICAHFGRVPRSHVSTTIPVAATFCGEPKGSNEAAFLMSLCHKVYMVLSVRSPARN